MQIVKHDSDKELNSVFKIAKFTEYKSTKKQLTLKQVKKQNDQRHVLETRAHLIGTRSPLRVRRLGLEIGRRWRTAVAALSPARRTPP